MGRRTSPINKAPILGYHVINKAGGGAAPWTPASITGLKLWIDFSDADTLFTDAGTTKVSADGDAIYQANDKSGNSFNFTQATLGSRPLYKTNIINSLSCGYIVNTSGSLSNTSYVDCAAMTSIIVLRPYNLQSYMPFHTALGAGDVESVFGLQYWNGKIRASTQTTSLQQLTGSGAAIANNTNYVLSLTYDSSEFKIFKNGNNVTDGTKSATGNFRFKYMGGQLMYWAEWIAYDSALSDANRQAVEAYLNDKWSVYVPAKMQSLGSMLSFEPEEEKLWWQGESVLDKVELQAVELSWWDKASKVVDEALAKSRKWIVTTWHKIGKAIEDYFSYDEEE